MIIANNEAQRQELQDIRVIRLRRSEDQGLFSPYPLELHTEHACSSATGQVFRPVNV